MGMHQLKKQTSRITPSNSKRGLLRPFWASGLQDLETVRVYYIKATFCDSSEKLMKGRSDEVTIWI